MKTGSFFSLLLFVFSVCSCSSKQSVTNAKDYMPYLDPVHFSREEIRLKKETAFWAERLQKDTASYVNLMELGRCFLSEFRLNADIKRLLAGDSLLKAASARLNHREPELLHALSQSSITRHRFKEAASFNKDAAIAGGSEYAVCLLGFDANMELGKYDEALTQLEKLKNKQSFDYLIRKAKWEDHLGNLDKAISLMEEAAQKTGKSRVAATWVQSNLGDMYGHAGQVAKSYQCYLTVLKNDPANFHCLQGIARIAFAHDRDAEAAKQIILFIQRYYKEPGLCLQLAEMDASAGREGEQEKNEHMFLEMVSNGRYGDMYNQYLIELLSEKKETVHTALRLARKEIKNRFTPETADYLALALLRSGEVQQAFQFSNAYVYRRSFEPNVQLHTAQIFAAAGRYGEARDLLISCRESAFELGPVKMKMVDSLERALP